MSTGGIPRRRLQFWMVVGLCATLAATFALAFSSAQERPRDTTASFGELDDAEAAFFCNAENVRSVYLGGGTPSIVRELSGVMTTRFNGERDLPLRMVALRVQEGRVTAQGESSMRRFRPGEEIHSFSYGREIVGFWTIDAAARTVRVATDHPLADNGVRFVREHVSVPRLMEVVSAGRGDAVLQLLRVTALRDRDLVVFTPIPDSWERLPDFTVHPTVVVFR